MESGEDFPGLLEVSKHFEDQGIVVEKFYDPDLYRDA